jgi:hypothetical protein
MVSSFPTLTDRCCSFNHCILRTTLSITEFFHSLYSLVSHCIPGQGVPSFQRHRLPTTLPTPPSISASEAPLQPGPPGPSLMSPPSRPRKLSTSHSTAAIPAHHLPPPGPQLRGLIHRHPGRPPRLHTGPWRRPPRPRTPRRLPRLLRCPRTAAAAGPLPPPACGAILVDSQLESLTNFTTVMRRAAAPATAPWTWPRTPPVTGPEACGSPALQTRLTSAERPAPPPTTLLARQLRLP